MSLPRGSRTALGSTRIGAAAVSGRRAYKTESGPRQQTRRQTRIFQLRSAVLIFPLADLYGPRAQPEGSPPFLLRERCTRSDHKKARSAPR